MIIIAERLLKKYCGLEFGLNFTSFSSNTHKIPFFLKMSAEQSTQSVKLEFPNFKYLNEVGTGFWHVRSKFYAGPLNIGTHMALGRLNNGKILVVDTVDITPAIKKEIDQLTDNGNLIEAAIATHPAHTSFFLPFHKLYPNVPIYGTSRHIANIKQINWAGDILNNLNKWESEGVSIRVPEGADFIDSGHFSGLFVYHQVGRTLFNDDTLTYLDNQAGCFIPCLYQCFGAKKDALMFHLTTLDSSEGSGLYCKESSPSQFVTFLNKVLDDWDFDNICTAHNGNRIGNGKEALRNAIAANQKSFDDYAKKFKGK